MSPTKAITFLGNVQKTQERPFGYARLRYIFGEQACETEFVAEAIYTFFAPEILYVLTTQEGCNNHFDDLKRRLEGRVILKYEEIPAPQRDDDVWAIFDTITRIIQPGDQVIFDVTLSFRSIPILGLIASSYLRSVRQVAVQALTYAEVTPGVYDAPLRDMTAFLHLLDWTMASDAFLRLGRFAGVSQLLTASSVVRPQLRDAAHLMEQLSRALLMTRPALAMEKAYRLGEAIQKLLEEAPMQNNPFEVLLGQIRDEYAAFGLAQPTSDNQATRREVLDRMLRMIDWYLDKDLPINAMTLAREWLVSVVVYYQGGDLFDDRRARAGAQPGARQHAEELINHGNANLLPEGDPLREVLPRIQTLWKRVERDEAYHQAADLRNDLAHAGMRRNARQPDEITNLMRDICAQLAPLLPPV